MDKLDMALDDIPSKDRKPRGRGATATVGKNGSGRGRRNDGGDAGASNSFSNPLSRDNDFDVPSAGGFESTGPARRERRSQRNTPYARPSSRAEGSWKRDGGASSNGRAPRAPASEIPRVITTSSSKVMVTNLDSEVTEEDIEEIFEQAGDIKSVAIKKGSSGKSLGTAEVVFVKKAAAAQVVKDFDGAEVDGRPMYLRLVESAGPVVKRKTDRAPRATAADEEQPMYRAGSRRGTASKDSLFGSKIDELDHGEVDYSEGPRRGRDRNGFGSFGRNGSGNGRQQQGGQRNSRGRGRGNTGRGGRGRGKGGKGGRSKEAAPTSEALDADMDSYFASNKTAEAGMTDE